MTDHLISHLAVESRITFRQNFGKRLTPSLEVVTLVNPIKAFYSIYHSINSIKIHCHLLSYLTQNFD